MPLTSDEIDRFRERGRIALGFAEDCRADKEEHRYFQLPPPYEVRTATGIWGAIQRGLYQVFGPYVRD